MDENEWGGYIKMGGINHWFTQICNQFLNLGGCSDLKM